MAEQGRLKAWVSCRGIPFGDGDYAYCPLQIEVMCDEERREWGVAFGRNIQHPEPAPNGQRESGLGLRPVRRRQFHNKYPCWSRSVSDVSTEEFKEARNAFWARIHRASPAVPARAAPSAHPTTHPKFRTHGIQFHQSCLMVVGAAGFEPATS